MTPTRVLWLIKGLGPGGAERMLVEMAPHVDRRRFEVQVAYLLPWKDHLVGELEARGVAVTCLGRDPRWAIRLRKLVRGRDIELVHAHLPAAAIGARAAFRVSRHRPRLVSTEHNTWERYRPGSRRLNAWTFSWQDASIAVSEDVARSIGRRSQPPLHVIANGVDIERLRSTAFTREDARENLGLPGDAPVVGTVGGITPKKGHSLLVAAARVLARELPEVRFVFIGLPVDEARIRREIDAAGLNEHVILAGYRPEAARLMPAFDVYCLPSLFEGMPVSLIEAMALGLPSVATGVGGVREVATDGEDAIVVAAGSPAPLVGALRGLLADVGRREALGKAAGATADRFDIRGTVWRTEEVYDEALSR